MIFSERDDGLVSSRICSRILHGLIGGMGRQVWFLYISPRNRGRLCSFKRTHVEGIQIGVGVRIEDIGVMVENGCKVGRVKLTWGGFLSRP